ncbi:MAG: S1 RNA-binding domain-containing protein, partial [Clostridia bacterium]|nr:S1 RNA-binding domain-containing protein [Clostridia bacterium]
MQNKYKPEGFNARQGAKQSILTSPVIFDDKIYEGVVKKCDSSLNLWVDLEGTTCLIPKDEVCYLFPGEILKDIAIISRVSKSVCFKLKDVAKGPEGNEIFIASRKEAQKECITNYVAELNVGDIIDARVTHMEQFGAFCDIGCGISALLCVDCISVSRIAHPKDRFSVGDRIRAIVKSKSDDGRVYLTHKELLGTWE